MLARFHSASHIPVDGYLDDNLNANDLIIKGSEFQALNELAGSLSTLKLLEEQNYDYVCHIILSSKARDHNSGFNKDINILAPPIPIDISTTVYF